MNFIKPRSWKLEETSSGPRVIISVPGLWPVTVFLGLWLCGWAAGEASAAKALWGLTRSWQGWPTALPAAFLAVWLAGWTAGGLFVWGFFLFSLRGREVVTLEGAWLRVRLETVMGLRWGRRFPLQGMAPAKLELTGVPLKKPSFPGGPSSASLSHIAIEGGGGKWKLGAGLDENAGRELLHVLVSRFGVPPSA